MKIARICLRFIASITLMASILSVDCRVQGQTTASPPAGTTLNDPLGLYKQTGIDKEQENKINALVQSFDALLRQKVNVLIGLMKDLRTLSLKPDPDEKAVFEKQEEVNKLNNEMAIERLRLMLNIRHILTPAQKQKLVQLMQASPGQPAAPPLPAPGPSSH